MQFLFVSFFLFFFFVVPNASLLLCHTQIRMDFCVRAFVCVSPFHVYLQLQALHIVFIIKMHEHSIGTS